MEAANALTADPETPETAPIAGEVVYLADAPGRSLDEAVAAAERVGKPLKVRTSLQLWNADAKPGGQFRGWRGQAWTIPVAGAEGAGQLRQVIEIVFDLVRLGGIEQVLKVLTALKANFAA